MLQPEYATRIRELTQFVAKACGGYFATAPTMPPTSRPTAMRQMAMGTTIQVISTDAMATVVFAPIAQHVCGLCRATG